MLQDAESLSSVIGCFGGLHGVRTHGEEFTVNAAGQSYISYADYAIAVVNEAEQAAHVGERFSVYAK